MVTSAASPVVVGIGQLANKDPDRILHPVDLIEAAALAALTDAGVELRDRIGWVGATPLSIYSTDHAGAMVAERLGLPPGVRSESRYSGAGPQRLLAEAWQAVARGEVDAALVVGGVGEASVRRARQRGLEPPAPPTSIWSQGSDGAGMGERVRGGSFPARSAEADAGAQLPSSIFALVDSAIAAAERRSWQDHRRHLGELMVPFTEAAATRPDVAWFPDARTADELATPGPANRFVAEPYTKLMCSFPTVDLAAAVVVCSTELADRLGVPAGHRVHPWSLALAKEPGPPSHRPEIGRSLALRAAVDRALADAAVGQDAVGVLDLYSCFPAAVELAVDAFGIPPGDRRPLTVTGGLPYFGGPGASYSLHSLVCVAEECRRRPGLLAGVVGVGGMVNDFAVGLYSTEPPTRTSLPADLGAVEPPAGTGVDVVAGATGPAVVEAMTVLHDRDAGPVDAPVVARLPDGTRVGARLAGGSRAAAEVSGTSLVGREVHLRAGEGGTAYDLG